jgi:hypothetical protein
MASSNLALKEWAIALQALMTGDSILLLRKGGIREKSFALPRQSRECIPQATHPRFWLYPTYEHQQPHLLKPTYASQVQSVPSGWHPETVEITAWAELTDCWEVETLEQVSSLAPFHIWTEQFVMERWHWKPSSPLLVLLLRTYKLDSPQVIDYCTDYGGCKSWINLPLELDQLMTTSQPALSEIAYGDRLNALNLQQIPSA